MQLLDILIRLLFIGVLFWGCGSNEEVSNSKEVAFYYWKSRCQIRDDFSYSLYIKVLDISQKSVIKTKCPKREFTPVVYIDNHALKNRDDIAQIIFKTIPQNTKEIQIDCDWTKSTQKKYFALLKEIKKQYKRVTATIRLHQLKYQTKTGVPPVDGGVLMFYNMSDFLDPNTQNYILDLDEAKKYLRGFKSYPLELDLALPIYSMATVFRYNRVVSLIDGITTTMLDNRFKKLSNGRYKVLKTHYFYSKLLYEGDEIRVDEVSIKKLREVLKLIPFKYNRVIFFRYSSVDIQELLDKDSSLSKFINFIFML